MFTKSGYKEFFSLSQKMQQFCVLKKLVFDAIDIMDVLGVVNLIIR